MSTATASGNVIRKYLPVYFVLLGIFLVEVFLAFRDFSTANWSLCSATGLCSAALGLMYFMHLAEERRGLIPHADTCDHLRPADDEHDLDRQRPAVAHEAAGTVV